MKTAQRSSLDLAWEIAAHDDVTATSKPGHNHLAPPHQPFKMLIGRAILLSYFRTWHYFLSIIPQLKHHTYQLDSYLDRNYTSNLTHQHHETTKPTQNNHQNVLPSPSQHVSGSSPPYHPPRSQNPSNNKTPIPNYHPPPQGDLKRYVSPRPSLPFPLSRILSHWLPHCSPP